LGVGVLDPHGDLTTHVLAHVPEKRLGDVILLDLADYHTPFGLNLFTCPDPTDPQQLSLATNKVMHIFKKLWGKGGIVVEDAWGVLLEELLTNATLTLLEASPAATYTMAEIPLLLEQEGFRQQLVNALANRHVKNYWLNRYNRLTQKDQLDERRSTLTRVNAFLTQPLVEHIVGQARSTIDFRTVMDERKILLVKLDNRLEDVTSLIGSMIIAEFLTAAYSRADLPVNKRKQFNLYADEFHRFAIEDLATLLTEARKFGITTTIAHQTLAQISERLQAAALQAAILVVFRVSGEDAQTLAMQYERTPPPPEIEWIEEHAGEKPVKTYVFQVLDHLLTHDHEDPRVKLFVRDILRPLDSYGHSQISSPIYEPKPTSPSASTLLIPLNDWLYSGMAGQSPLWQKPAEEVLKWLVYFFGYRPSKTGFEDIDFVYNALYPTPYIGVAGPVHPLTELAKRRLACQKAGYLAETTEAITRAFIDFLTRSFPSHAADFTRAWDGGQRVKGISLATSDLGSIRQLRDKNLDQIDNQVRAYTRTHPKISMREYEACYKTGLAKRGIEVFLLEALRCGLEAVSFAKGSDTQPGTDAFAQKVYTETQRRLTHYVKQFYRYQQFRATLLLAQLGLNQMPIMTMDSGRYEPEVRKHPVITQRTYPEMTSKIANTLTNLPNFTSRVKIATQTGTSEQTITTQRPTGGVGQAELWEREQAIRDQNLRDGYLRERKAVEEEIQRRQERCLQLPRLPGREPPQPPEDEPPISRRPPR
jgi:hypothetical protein